MIRNNKIIIYIGNFELPDKNAAAQRVIANGKIFRELGYNVVYIGINSNLDSNSNIKDTYKRNFGFDSWEIPYPKNKIEWFTRIITPAGLETVITSYSAGSLFAVIPYNYPAIAQYKVMKFCRKHNAYYIPDITEWYESSARGSVTGFIKWLDTLLRMKILNHKADALITTSTYLTKFYNSSVKNIIELPTLYDSEMLKKIEKRTFPPSNNTIKLVYAGSPFGPNINYKNRQSVKDRLDKIIILLHKIKCENYKLDIYGITKERYLEVYPEHEPILSKHDKEMVFNGRKPHQEIISSIKQSHFSVFFRDVVRLTEAGFPSKLSESITAGTPVITNMISNLEPYLSKEKNIHIIDLKNDRKKTYQIEKILSLSFGEIDKKKKECLESKIFDYRSYIHPMKTFLQGLKTQNK